MHVCICTRTDVFLSVTAVAQGEGVWRLFPAFRAPPPATESIALGQEPTRPHNRSLSFLFFIFFVRKKNKTVLCIFSGYIRKKGVFGGWGRWGWVGGVSPRDLHSLSVCSDVPLCCLRLIG